MWVARDKNDALCLYSCKPKRLKRDGAFAPNGQSWSAENCIGISKKSMLDITWENSPQKVNILSNVELEAVK